MENENYYPPNLPFSPPAPPAPDGWLEGWAHLPHFHAWCLQILPTVFDNSMSYYEFLCKLQWFIEKIIGNMEIMRQAFEKLQQDETEFKNLLTEQW